MKNKYTEKYREKYTRQEIVDMADRCYNRCVESGCPYRQSVGFRDENNDRRLFLQSRTGCRYSYELPWGMDKWCCFYPPKRTIDVDRLKLLTFNNLINSIAKQSR